MVAAFQILIVGICSVLGTSKNKRFLDTDEQTLCILIPFPPPPNKFQKNLTKFSVASNILTKIVKNSKQI